MKKGVIKGWFLIVVVSLHLFSFPVFSQQNLSSDISSYEAFSNKQPVFFRKNVGQWDDKILMQAVSKGTTMSLMRSGLSFGYAREKETPDAGLNRLTNQEFIVWNLDFIGANPSAEILFSGKEDSKTTYINSRGTFPNVPDYTEATLKNIFPKIDLHYYPYGSELKYDYVLHPSANISAIRIACKGVKEVQVNRMGELEITTPWGVVSESAPYSYQIINGKKIEVNVVYEVLDDNKFGFKILGAYNPAFDLVIDPVVLRWSTYVAGNTNNSSGYIYDVATDPSGNVYGTGYNNLDFPVTPGTYQTFRGTLDTFGGDQPQAGCGDIFVFKLNPSGTNLLWAVYIGGALDEVGRGIKANAAGQVFVAGATESDNFPVVSAVQSSNSNPGLTPASIDVVAFKLNAAGTGLLYSTYLGGEYHDIALDNAISATGEQYVVGYTESSDFDITGSAFQGTYRGAQEAFVTKLTAGGGLSFSSYLGGNSNDYAAAVAVDAGGNAYVVGNTSSANFPITGGFDNTLGGSWDDFIVKVNSTGTTITYSSYIGGSGSDGILFNGGYNGPGIFGTASTANGVAVDASGNAYVTGTTQSNDFPSAMNAYAGLYDVYAMKINPAGSGIVYSRYIGTADQEVGCDIAVTGNGEAFLITNTNSTAYPTTNCAYDRTHNGSVDVALTKLNSTGTTIDYSTYYGGSAQEYADPSIALVDTGCLVKPVVCFTSHSYLPISSPPGYMPNPGTYQDNPALFQLRPKINPGFTATGGGGGCGGGTYTFTDTTSECGLWKAFYHRDWNFGDGQTGTGITVNHTYASPGTYTVTLTVGCPDSTVTKVINVASGGGVSLSILSSAPPTCFGGNNGQAVASASGGSGYNYVWSNAATGATVTNLTQGTFTVTVTDASLCTATATVSLTQPTVLSAATASTNAGCSPTGSVSVTAAGGTGAYTYLWSNASSAQTVTNLGAATYTVTVRDNNNCSTTSTAAVASSGGGLVLNSPAITHVSCFSGSDGVAAVSVAGVGAYTYTWSNGATSSTVSNLGANTYTVTVSDGGSCSTTTSITLTAPLDISVTTSSSSATCGSSNGSAYVTLVSGGNGGFSYLWSSGSGAATANSLAGGSFTVTVTDSKNCVKTSSVIVNSAGGPSVTLSSKSNITCFGQANGSVSVLGTGGSGTYTYLWSNGATSSAISNLAGGAYVVTVDDGGTCPAIASYTINVPADIVVSTSATSTACGTTNGQVAVTASGGTGVLSFNWSNGATSQTVSALSAGNYNVTVIDGNACSRTASAAVSSIGAPTVTVTSLTNVSCFGSANGAITVGASGGSSPYNYTWSTTPVQSTSSATNLTAGTYFVTVNDGNNCAAIASASVTEPALLSFIPSGAQTVCAGQSATLSVSASGGTTNYTYAWLPGGLSGVTVTVSPASTTTYTVAVVDANGCTTIPQTVVVTVGAPLNLSASNPPAVCSGASVTVAASASGGNNIYTYLWSNGSTNASTNVSPLNSTTYTVTVTDGCNSPASTAIVSVLVNQPPVVTFSADTLQGCVPLLVTFVNTTANSASCRWDFGDGGTSAICGANHQYISPGQFDVSLTVIDGNGCSGSYINNNMITVHGLPTADFTMSSNNISILEPTVFFTDQSSGAVSWSWNFGDPSDATISTLQNPSHTYSDTGVYCVELAVANLFGCADTTTGCLYVEPDFTIYIPNAFSPNDDGLNEIFHVKGTNIRKIELLVFDRWGDLIFKSTDINTGWDGKANGGDKLAQQDVYVYRIYATDHKNFKHTYTGHITLVK